MLHQSVLVTYGVNELIELAMTLEEKLIEAYEEQGMTRSDAQGVVDAITMQI